MFLQIQKETYQWGTMGLFLTLILIVFEMVLFYIDKDPVCCMSEVGLTLP